MNLLIGLKFLTKCLKIKCKIALYNDFWNIDYIMVKL